jgi:hypothetical protein
MPRLQLVPLVVLMISWSAAASAVIPESSEVRAVLDAALRFLEERASDDRLGAKCLVGLALAKNGRAADQPQIVRAIEACRAATRQGAEELREDIYSTSLAVIFLCEIDGGQRTYEREINILLKSLRLRQKEHGGWGYPAPSMTGDTSMTQYGVLSAWAAWHAGYGLSEDSVERVCNWLLRTQDPSGAWGYQGEDPGSHQLVPQKEIRPSLSAAGLGSVLICAQLLGVALADDGRAGEPRIPAALKPVAEASGPRRRPGSAKVERRLIREAFQRGNQWFARNYTIQPPRWVHYYLYALERYMSFRELVEHETADDPRWYRDGFRYLARTQGADGSWTGDCGQAVDTAFGVLFLSRSTKRSIQQAYGTGTLTGGRGLPHDIADARLRRGKVVPGGLSQQTLALIDALADPEHPDHDYLIENPDELVAGVRRASLEGATDRLDVIVREGPAEARIVAVRALARLRDLERVPALLYALTDPDWRVVREADHGLRFVSRRFGPSELPQRKDEVARQHSIERWRRWYATVRPQGPALEE